MLCCRYQILLSVTFSTRGLRCYAVVPQTLKSFICCHLYSGAVMLLLLCCRHQILSSVTFCTIGLRHDLRYAADTKRLHLSRFIHTVQDGLYALRKTHKRSTLSLRSSPSVVTEAVSVLLIDDCPFLSFQGRSLRVPLSAPLSPIPTAELWPLLFCKHQTVSSVNTGTAVLVYMSELQQGFDPLCVNQRPFGTEL